jgi:hypothetical protein
VWPAMMTRSWRLASTGFVHPNRSSDEAIFGMAASFFRGLPFMGFRDERGTSSTLSPGRFGAVCFRAMPRLPRSVPRRLGDACGARLEPCRYGVRQK